MSFAEGETVRVLDLEKPGHVRTPRYVRRKKGKVVRLLGEFRNPEDLAYGGDGLPEKALYRVLFEQSDLWENYDGLPEDALVMDIYEHWLEKA